MEEKYSFYQNFPLLPAGSFRYARPADPLTRKGDMHLTDFSEYVK